MNRVRTSVRASTLNVSHAPISFRVLGLDDPPARVAVILGGFKLLMTGFAVKYVDSVGRRPLLLGRAVQVDPGLTAG